MRRALLCLLLSSLILISSITLLMQSQIAYAHAETEVKFTANDVDVSAGGHTINISLTLRVTVNVEGLVPLIPPIAFSGFGGDLHIAVQQETGSLTLKYDGTLHNKGGFLTPLEPTEIEIASVPEGNLYAILSPSLSACISVEGEVSVEPDVLNWTSEGAQTIHIEHGPMVDKPMSIFAFSRLGFKIRLLYSLDITVGARSDGSPVFERTASLGALEGQPIVEITGWLIPIVPIVGGLILLAIVVAVVRRRRRARAQPIEVGRQRVRCPRCGYEFFI